RKQQNEPSQSSGSFGSKQYDQSSIDISTYSMLIVIVIVFFCCWTPSYIWWLLLMAGDSFQTFSVWNSFSNTVMLILTYVSCCSNP
ncbi:hypothetical protein PENTCL1PPCAC_30105, partial [Pristionchus entomophagus]